MKIFIVSICFTNIEKKHHVSKFWILTTIIIQIDKKNMKKTLLNFRKDKIQTVQVIINQFNWGKN